MIAIQAAGRKIDNVYPGDPFDKDVDCERDVGRSD